MARYTFFFPPNDSNPFLRIFILRLWKENFMLLFLTKGNWRVGVKEGENRSGYISHCLIRNCSHEYSLNFNNSRVLLILSPFFKWPSEIYVCVKHHSFIYRSLVCQFTNVAVCRLFFTPFPFPPHTLYCHPLESDCSIRNFIMKWTFIFNLEFWLFICVSNLFYCYFYVYCIFIML